MIDWHCLTSICNTVVACVLLRCLRFICSALSVVRRFGYLLAMADKLWHLVCSQVSMWAPAGWIPGVRHLNGSQCMDIERHCIVAFVFLRHVRNVVWLLYMCFCRRQLVGSSVYWYRLSIVWSLSSTCCCLDVTCHHSGPSLLASHWASIAADYRHGACRQMEKLIHISSASLSFLALTRTWTSRTSLWCVATHVEQYTRKT